jgi:hypothetical protein
MYDSREFELIRRILFWFLVALVIESIAYSIFSDAHRDSISMPLGVLIAFTGIGFIASIVLKRMTWKSNGPAVEDEAAVVEPNGQTKSRRAMQTVVISLVCAMLAFIPLNMGVVLFAGDAAADRLSKGYMYPVIAIFFVIFLPLVWFTGGKIRLGGRNQP